MEGTQDTGPVAHQELLGAFPSPQASSTHPLVFLSLLSSSSHQTIHNSEEEKQLLPLGGPPTLRRDRGVEVECAKETGVKPLHLPPEASSGVPGDITPGKGGCKEDLQNHRAESQQKTYSMK